MKELKVALEAADAASKIILRYFGKTFQIRHKGEINLVTEVDEKAQKAIVRVIQKYFPKDSVLAEEGDLSKTRTASRLWIVDPLDGTTNFAHGYPRFCVSIGFECEGQMQCGVVHDPVMKEVFRAEKGKGAFLNKRRLQVSKIKSLRQSLLVTGFPYDLNDPKTDNIPYFLHLLKKVQAIRRDGSAALNLAYVAAGRFDGLWELGLNPWDVAAGILLIEEAGGRLANFSPETTNVDSRNPHWICANPFIFEDLKRELLGARS